MILVGIYVAKNKHDIVITNDSGKVFSNHFTIDNSLLGYKKLLDRIEAAKDFFDLSIVRVGLE